VGAIPKSGYKLSHAFRDYEAARIFAVEEIATEETPPMPCHRDGHDAQIIGEVVADHPGLVAMWTRIGGSRIVDRMLREQLPRIC
jgi:hydrogenase expression/formation protein HypE